LGKGDNLSIPNALQPDRLDTGITVIGKGAHLPAGVQLGRNVLVNADRNVEDFPTTNVPDGATI
jgi:glucose-1-phosphate adenylyltransferase